MSFVIALKTTRPSFLLLSPVCVLLGLSTAISSGSQINSLLFFLIFIGAISAHISVNTLNEYYDFKTGLDFRTEKTSFSGGSGALPENPAMAKNILILGFVTLIITMVIGVYLIMLRGMQILPIGLLGVALITTYTQWLNRSPFLCLIAPGLGFGVLMVVGTHIILTGENSLLPWLVSLVPFFLINNLLLLNQYPDIKADASVGRNTFPIAFGLDKSNCIYTVFFIAAYALILLLAGKNYIPELSIISFIPIVFSLVALFGAYKYVSAIGRFPQFLGANVAAAILTPLFLAIAMIVG